MVDVLVKRFVKLVFINLKMVLEGVNNVMFCFIDKKKY